MVFLDHSPDRVQRLQGRTFCVETSEGVLEQRVPVVRLCQCQEGGALLILATKNHSLEAAISNLPSAKEWEVVLVVQNGLGVEQKVRPYCRPGALLRAVLHLGASLQAEGHVRLAGLGPVVLDASHPRVGWVCQLLQQAGLEARPTTSIEKSVWQKALLNSAINPLTAILQVPNGVLLKHASTKWLLEKLLQEGARVAQKQGVDIQLQRLIEMAERILRKTASNRSSMLQDILRRRPTEVESLNGQMVRLARQSSLSVPAQETILHLVQALEETKEKRCLSKS